jgi:hypothetical protein
LKEIVNNSYKFHYLNQAYTDTMLDEFIQHILSYDEKTLSKIKSLLENRLFNITFDFIKIFKLESVNKFYELKQEFEEKQTNPKFKQYLEAMYKSSLKKDLGEDKEVFESIFLIYTKREIKRFNYLLFGNNNIPEENLKLEKLLPTESSDVKEITEKYKSIIENEELNKYSEKEFKALQESLKANIKYLVAFEKAFPSGVKKLLKDENLKQLFILLDEKLTLENLKIVVMHLAEKKRWQITSGFKTSICRNLRSKFNIRY